MVPVKIIDRIASDLDLTSEELMEGSIRSELMRRLASYKFTDYLLSKKYKMSLEQFEKKKIISKKGYSFEVEDDYHNWDQAIDAIKNLEKDLKILGK